MHFQAVRRKDGTRGGTSVFQLRYIHDVGTDPSIGDLITRVCPRASSIFLDTPDQQTLEKLSALKSLKKLKLNKVNFELVLDTLRTMNYNITAIELVSAKGSLDLSLLSHHCPNLQTLEVFYSQTVLTKGGKMKTLHQLKKCVIYSTKISGEASLDILQNCPAIEHLNLSSAATLENLTLSNIIVERKLENLSELVLLSAPLLDLVSIELLVRPLNDGY